MGRPESLRALASGTSACTFIPASRFSSGFAVLKVSSPEVFPERITGSAANETTGRTRTLRIGSDPCWLKSATARTSRAFLPD